jgi:poly-gamma-glutamate synthesis protein (capsule biosynthesis protein)
MAINWKKGVWRKDSGVALPTQSVIVAGDWASIREYETIVLSRPESIYGDLLPCLRDADSRIVNLECSLSSLGSPIAKAGKNLRGKPESIKALSLVPFDVACLANNHIMDFGSSALNDTRMQLHANGIRTVGAGLSRQEALEPLVVDIAETRLGIVNFCEGEDDTSATNGPGVFGWEIETIVDTVQKLRSRVDVIVVIGHAGREYTPAPPPYIQKVFRTIAQNGADIVIGHHPHVPQGIELFEGIPIVYSLGNFVFSQYTKVKYQRRGYLLSIELTHGKLSGFALIPYMLRDSGLQKLTGIQKTSFLRRLRVVSEILATPDQVSAIWNAFIDSFGETYWKENCGGIADLVNLMRQGHVNDTARLRNRFLTPAHRHFIADGLTRVIVDQTGSSPPWAVDLVQEWKALEEMDAE